MKMSLNKNFWILWISTFLFFSAFYSLIIPLPNYLKSIGINDLQLGLILGALGITSLIVRPFTGVLTDRFGRKKIILAGVSIFMIGVGITVITRSAIILFIARGFQALGYVAFTTAATTLIGDYTNNDKSGTSMAIYGAAANVAMTFVPLVINFLLKFVSFKTSFIYSIFLAFIGGITILLIPEKIKTTKSQMFNFEQLRDLKVLIFPIITAISFGIGFGSFFQFVPLLAQNNNTGTTGTIFLVFGITIISVRILFKFILAKFTRKIIILFTIILMAIGLLLFGITEALIFTLIASSFIAISCGLIHPLLLQIHFERISNDNKGLGSAAFYFGFDIGIGMGAWILSPVLFHLGISGLYITGAILTITGLIPAYQIFKTKLNLRRKYVISKPQGN